MEIQKNKIFFILLALIVISGIFLRTNELSEVGYWTDDEATIPAGLMWFYPQPYFPGLNYGNPPLADLIIGAGCMLSEEDFSGASNIKPFFYPDRFYHVGPGLANANFYCHLPIFVFGMIFFFLIIYFSITFFNKYSALFLISFFAFSPEVLKYSRWIKPEIILWTFTLLSFIFLLNGYKEDKFSKKEKIYLLLSSIFIGLAFASKFSIAFMVIIYLILIIKKYFRETVQILSIITKKLTLNFLNRDVNKEDCFKFFKLITLFIIAYILSFLIFFKLNPKNFINTYTYYQNINKNLASSSFKFNNLFEYLKNLLLKLNLLDVILFIFAFYLYYKLIKKEDKSHIEIFILFLSPTSFMLALFFPVFITPYRTIPYLLGFIFLVSLTFSKISPLNKLSSKYLFLIILIYFSFSFYNAFSLSPNFENKNPLVCSIQPETCEYLDLGYSLKQTADYLKENLNGDETFIGSEGVIFFYLRHSQGILDWNFHQSFIQQLGREPTLQEKIQYFKPENQTVRYLLLDPSPRQRFKEAKEFKETFQPNHIIKIKGKDAMFIYDLKNLKPK